MISKVPVYSRQHKILTKMDTWLNNLVLLRKVTIFTVKHVIKYVTTVVTTNLVVRNLYKTMI